MSVMPSPNADPGRTALYRIRGEEDVLLYIGITNGVPFRWNSHQTVQPWWDELRSLTVEWHGTRAEAEEAEKAAIGAEQPKYNVTYLKPSGGKGRREHPPVTQIEHGVAVIEPRDDDDDLLWDGDVAKMLRFNSENMARKVLKRADGPEGFLLAGHRRYRRRDIRQWIADVELSQNPRAAAPARQAPKKRGKVPKPSRAAGDENALFDLQVIPGGAA